MKKFPKEMYIARRAEKDVTYFETYDTFDFGNEWNGEEIAVYQLVRVGKLNVKTTVTIDKPKQERSK